ncbi:ABC transporter ATP-binding protein/permease [Myxococcota bacterium]|nr:ABC transporter ATP-binding protein/permease [Myxococcota bacterium]
MRRLLRFWREYARRYRRYYLLGVIALIATNVLTVAIPSFVQHAVDALAEGSDAMGWVWALAITGLGVMGVRTLSRTLFFNPGRTVEFRVKVGMFEHLLELPKLFYDRLTVGDIISRGTNDANAMRALIGYGTLQLFNVALTLTLTLGRMIQLDWALTLICLPPLILAALIMRHAVLSMFGLFGQAQAQLSRLSARILESYHGVGVVQAYGAEAGVLARFDEENDQLYALSERLLWIRAWLLPVVGGVGQACVVLLLYFGGARVIAGELSVGLLTAFIVYIQILVPGLTSLGFLIGAAQRGYIGLGRIYEVLDAPLERPEAEAAAPQGGGAPRLEVEDLHFSYPARETGVKSAHPTGSPQRDTSDALPAQDRGGEGFGLKGLRFKAEGQVLGIFGLTGAGKSTLLDLLARVYDPPPNTVRLNGVDVRALPLNDYWRAVAYVPQSAFLFSQSARANIALGADEIDEARLAAAIEDAALEDLEGLSEGLDTIIGERGVTLSGGQRQRAALARAYYRDFDLLLLDDVMSAVDTHTERRLIEALYRRAKGQTVVLVSHRISALAEADHIIVLHEGAQIDEGSHAALISREGPYREAWRLQRLSQALG